MYVANFNDKFFLLKVNLFFSKLRLGDNYSNVAIDKEYLV
jgi:hypothetical protein